jgi:hypothetical protein
MFLLIVEFGLVGGQGFVRMEVTPVAGFVTFAEIVPTAEWKKSLYFDV